MLTVTFDSWRSLTVASRAKVFCCLRDILSKLSITSSSAPPALARRRRALIFLASGERLTHQLLIAITTNIPSTTNTPETSATVMFEASASSSTTETHAEVVSTKSSVMSDIVPSSRRLSVAWKIDEFINLNENEWH